jgi:hypothetical protein
MRITNGGNVGINSTAPAALLTVNGDSILGSIASSANYINSNGTGSFAGGDSAGSAGTAITSSDLGSFAFGYAHNDSIISNNEGSIAMGSTQSGTILSAYHGTIAMGYADFGTIEATTSSGAIAMGYASSGTLEATGTGSVAMGYASTTLAATGNGSVAMGENVQATAANAFALGETVINSTASSFMVGFTATPTLTVTGSDVGIGTTTLPGQLLDVWGTARLLNSGNLTVAGLVSCGGVQTSAAGLMSCTSDKRLKDIHGSFNKGLIAVSQLHPKTYSWKKDSYLYDGGVLYTGFIAQDVEKVIPEAVNTGAKGYKQVSTTPILAAVVNSIRELDKKIRLFFKDPSDRIQALETEYKQKENKIKALEAQSRQNDIEIDDLQKRIDILEKNAHY